MIIFGAGLSGLLAARRLWPHQPEIFEKQATLPNNHSALLRFRSNIVGETLGIPFKKVNVYKGILQNDGITITNTPNLRDINSYSIKSIGHALERSIINTQHVERYIAPENLIERLSMDHTNIRYRCDCEDFIRSRSKTTIAEAPIISTIPMPELMRMLKYPLEIEFKTHPIWTINCELQDVNVYQTLYVPYDDNAPYRVSITGDLMTIESRAEFIKGQNWVQYFSMIIFGHKVEVKSTIKYKKQEYGKIVPIDDMLRKRFILWATDNFNIYSLGRYATWRNILLDDIMKDIGVIDSFITQRDYYRTRRSIGDVQ